MKRGNVYYKKNNNKYTGSGVLLLENYNNNQGRIEPAVILFRNKHMNAYADLGGHIDQVDLSTKYPLESAASREAFEESACLLKICKLKNATYVTHNSYFCYILGIAPGILHSKYYNDNLKIIQRNQFQYQYKETDGIMRFYLSDLLKTGLMTTKNDLPTIDANGNIAIVTGRTKALVREAMINGIIYANLVNPSPFKKKYSVVNGHKMITLSNA